MYFSPPAAPPMEVGLMVLFWIGTDNSEIITRPYVWAVYTTTERIYIKNRLSELDVFRTKFLGKLAKVDKLVVVIFSLQ